MRYKNPPVQSNCDDRAILERVLRGKQLSLYDLSLICGVSESSLYKYRQGWNLSPEIKKKIDYTLNNLDYELFEENEK